MMKTQIALSLALALGLTSSVAMALDTPDQSQNDNRIYTTNYKPQEVYPILAIRGMATVLTFSKGEEVQSWASGYSTAWEFDARDNHFFLKPKADDATTNLIVITNKHTYLFDLRLGKSKEKDKATYALQFAYPEEEALRLEQQKAQEERQALLDKNDLDSLLQSDNINQDYVMNFGKDEDSKNIAPIKAFDDGRFTYLKFRLQTDFPVAYQVQNKEEVLTNSHVQGDYLVLHGVFPEVHLRAGNSVVGIYNNAFKTQTFTDTPTKTTIGGLQRVITEAQ